MLIAIYLIPLLYHTFYLKPIPKWKVLKDFPPVLFSNFFEKETIVKLRIFSVCLCAVSIVSIYGVMNRRWGERKNRWDKTHLRLNAIN